ncbi:efflux RND transporter periplasmic adaptor subunit [Roseivivax marinus]|uniref:efflux RND transporter periplasmic adaptor subunit n=1 Tax=Roseivivax marinus TaxID=1379903 RepID=UPI0004B58D4A|nr:efflux RND transporter periplasmic adaptor subunit [Roseivivax marinus]
MFSRTARSRLFIFFSSLLLSIQVMTPATHAQPVGMPPGSGGPTEVGVITLKRQDVPVTVPGRAVAFEKVDIRPRVSGMISEIVYEPGGGVAVGDTLFRIESDTYAAEVASAEAEVARAEAAVSNAEATVARYQRLEGSGVTTEELESSRVSALQAQAELSSAWAALQVARLNLERTDITSPIQGIAAIPSVSVGALVTENQSDALTTVTRIDPIYVDVEESSQRIADVRARIDAGSLRPGENLDIQLRLENGETYASQG